MRRLGLEHVGHIVRRHFDFSRIAPDFAADAFEGVVLRCNLFRRAVDMPDVGVLGNDAHADFFAHRRDQQRNMPRWFRIELFKARTDDRHVALQGQHAGFGGAELVTIFVVIGLHVSRAHAEHKASVGDMVDGARHIRREVGIAIAIGMDDAADFDPGGRRRHRSLNGHRFEVLAAGDFRLRRLFEYVVAEYLGMKMVGGVNPVDTQLFRFHPRVSHRFHVAVLRN